MINNLCIIASNPKGLGQSLRYFSAVFVDVVKLRLQKSSENASCLTKRVSPPPMLIFAPFFCLRAGRVFGILGFVL
jgi:hypothetical protein